LQHGHQPQASHFPCCAAPSPIGRLHDASLLSFCTAPADAFGMADCRRGQEAYHSYVRLPQQSCNCSVQIHLTQEGPVVLRQQRRSECLQGCVGPLHVVRLLFPCKMMSDWTDLITIRSSTTAMKIQLTSTMYFRLLELHNIFLQMYHQTGIKVTQRKSRTHRGGRICTTACCMIPKYMTTASVLC
jgi:hypothetical protein